MDNALQVFLGSTVLALPGADSVGVPFLSRLKPGSTNKRAGHRTLRQRALALVSPHLGKCFCCSPSLFS